MPSRRSRLGLAHTDRDAFIYQPLIGLPICSLPASPLFFHGRYISLLSNPFPAPPPPNEPPVSTLRSPHPHRVLSVMAAFPHNHSSLVFQTPPSDHDRDHSASHYLFAAPVSLQGHSLFVSSIYLSFSSLKLLSNSASSCNHPSTTTTPSIARAFLGRVASLLTLHGLGPEASDAPSRECTF